MDAITLDETQLRAATLEFTDSALLWGAPGTGKSTALKAAVVNLLEQDPSAAQRLVVLSPSRASAALLKQQLSDEWGGTASSFNVQTWSALAFDAMNFALAIGAIDTGGQALRLLSGPEQDVLIAEILSGHASEQVPELDWPEGLQAALSTRGFRQELRELFDRMSELGLDSQDVTELAQRYSIAQWAPAAQLYQEYRDVLSLRSPEAFDPAMLLRELIELTQNNPEFLVRLRERYSWIFIDDLQDCTSTQVELLQVLLGRDLSVRALATMNPYGSVQGFRGSNPQAGIDALTQLHHSSNALRSVTDLVLATSYRLGEHALSDWKNVVQRIGLRAPVQLNHTVSAGRAQTLVQLATLNSQAQESRHIAGVIMDAHLDHGISFDSMAVIVRNSASVHTLVRSLTAMGIPATAQLEPSPMQHNAAVASLMDMAAIAAGTRELTEELAARLLTGPFGELSAIELKRWRTVVPDLPAALGSQEGPKLHQGPAGVARIQDMIAAARKKVDQKATIPEVLWALWDTSALAKPWRKAALTQGQYALFINANLDALLVLFATAERFTNRLSHAPLAQFIEYLDSQELPMDSLARNQNHAGSVEVLTVAASAGREWDLACVAGIQAGVWPNTRVRSQLMAVNELINAVRFHDARTEYSSLVKDVIFDELRTFSVAISRASKAVHLSAVESEQEQASSFLDIISADEDQQQSRHADGNKRTRTLRTLVAYLRKSVELEQSAAAAQLLAYLSALDEPVSAAEPLSWWGTRELSSHGQIVAESESLRVSPSRIQEAIENPLNWFLNHAGASASATFAQTIGTIVHEIAEKHPNASHAELNLALSERLSTLDLPDNWESKNKEKLAEQMVNKLGDYIAENTEREVIEQEVKLEVPISEAMRPAVLSGIVDRLEIDKDGRLFIVDFKTGSKVPTKDEILELPQLGAYQYAIEAGGFTEYSSNTSSGGAALVQLGKNTVQKLSVQTQEPLNSASWAEEKIVQAVTIMAAAEFHTIHEEGVNKYKTTCRYPAICPLCDGKQVTE